MTVNSKTITVEEFQKPSDLSIQILNIGNNDDGLVAIMHCNRTLNTILPSLRDIKKINETLYSSANEMVTQIRNGIKRKDLPTMLIDPSTGLAANGYLAQHLIFKKEIIEQIITALNRHNSPLIEINSDDFIIPWEWLFENHPQNFQSDRKLSRVMRSFWGCRRIITRRKFKESLAGLNHSTKQLSLPLKIGLIIDNSLGFAKLERKWFFDNNDGKNFIIEELKIKQNLSEWDFISSVNKFLNRKDIDIFHFACDSDVKIGDPLNSSLNIGDGGKYLLKYLVSEPKVELNGAFVFLNACATGVRNPEHTFNYVDQLIQRGAGTIIAVESSVNSQIAMNFAQLFYKRLVGGFNVGNSLYKARLDLIRNGRSSSDIVSLFYSLYGDPYLQANQCHE